MNVPFFSVCVPTYNMGHLIGAAVESVLCQNFEDFELLIQDNASTDNTRHIIQDFRDERIYYQINSENIGMFRNLNKLCERARGRYIKILCADDMLSKNCLSTIHRTLSEERYRYKLVSVRQTNHVDMLVNFPAISKLNKFVVYRDNLFRFLAKPNSWGGGLSAMCVERFFFEKHGFFGNADPAKDFSRDIITWFSMVLSADALLIDCPLVYQRIHSEQNRYRLSFINQLREIMDFFYGQETVLLSYNGFKSGRKCYVDRYVIAHYWYGFKSWIHGNGPAYLRKTRSMLRNYGYDHFPLHALLAKISNRIFIEFQKTWRKLWAMCR